MATIPLGNFGQAVARPGPLATIPRTDVVDQRGRTATDRLIGTVESVFDSDRQQQEELRDKADAAQSFAIVAEAKGRMRAGLDELGRDLSVGKVAKDQAVDEWKRRSQKLIDDAAGQLPPSRAEMGRAHLVGSAAEAAAAVPEMVARQDADDTRAGLGRFLEQKLRDALTDRRGAESLAISSIRQLGAAAGYSAAQQQEMEQRFLEEAAFNEGAAMVRGANATQLEQTAQLLKTDRFDNLSPRARAQLETQIASRQQYLVHEAERAANALERDENRSELEAYGRVQLATVLGQKVDPNDWMMLKPAHQAAAIHAQRSEARARRMEAEGRQVKTQWPLYLELRDQAISDPAKFATLDLRQYVDRIGGPQLEQLQDLKTRLAADLIRPQKAVRDEVTLTQQMNATMSALKIKRPEDRGQFMSFVQSGIDDAQQAKGGKRLSFAERQQVIDQAVLQGPDPDAWLWGQKRMYQLTPDQRARFKPNAPSDAPATELDALNEALSAQGLQQSAANRLRLYQRTMNKGQQQ